jgi:predicted Rdx family selenoprotein
MIPFSLLWGGFAMFWEYSVLRHSSSAEFALWGIPFVLIGLYLIVGRFFVDAFQRARTVYAVTDRRILIVRTWWNKEVTSVSSKPLPEISLTEKSDGSGTITFGPRLPYSRMMGGGWPGASKQAVPAFEFVERVRSVYDLIQASSN